ncbi:MULTISPECIES: TIGR03086 family metal-binding protein [Mumia]|uniref:TIGR03086 family metal-binding protein n=1 Tax=Mumia TaxID=1546255 RepID=UPI0014205DD2|nr:MULTISPECIES: TIGR03086 family metal-binding protein [unclassified Mumia]QMW67030.1 TIGR03086 family protein [Mumia sp. ZJ1417]
MPDLLDLGPSTRRVAALLDGVGDDDLTRPTPCDYDVATLLEHLDGLSLAFTLAARKSDDPMLGAAPAPSGAALSPGWRQRIPERLDALAEAWRSPEAWEGEATAGGVTMPADIAATVALDEVVLHGWDLARATGQPYEVDPGDLAVVHRFVEESAKPEQAQAREGLFGPPLPVPGDAPLLDRVVALAGRSPSWPH